MEDAVVVTQGYHLPRAVYTCRRAGIDAVGLALVDWENAAYAERMPGYQAREVLSTFKALWQVHVTKPDPHFLQDGSESPGEPGEVLDGEDLTP